MVSLWDEASRDAEVESRIRRTAMAESELDQGVFSFVALSKSASEYEHRKAMVEDRLHHIAEKTENTFEDIEKILDKRMSYILEASKVAGSGKFVLIDPNGKRVGGPFSSRELAEKAKGKAEQGTHIVSMSSKDDDLPDFLKDKKDKDEGDDEDSEKDDEDKEESEDEDEKDDNKKESSLNRAMRMIRTALENEVDPIEWVGDLPASSTPEAVPSEHNEDSDPKANLPGGHIPDPPDVGLDHSGWINDSKEASIGNPMNPLMNNTPGTGLGPGGSAGQPGTPGAPGTPLPNAPGTSPSSPLLQGDPNSLTGAPGEVQSNPTTPPSGGTDPSNRASQGMNGMASLRQTISRYNPHLPPRKVDEVARKVAMRYLSVEETR